MSNPQGEKIESIPELAEWLPRAGVSSAVTIAQCYSDNEQMHIVLVNGTDEFLMASAVACMQFLDFIGDRLKLNDPTPPASRAERRRAARKH